MSSPLPAQLATASRETTHLNLEEDIPSDSDWALLSSHFTSVTHLYMDSGWNEELGDAGIPLHWPLEKITIGSACGDVCTSPWIVEGRAKHLVFCYTAGLRFEGPTTNELLKGNNEAIATGEKEAMKAGNVTLTWVPDLARDWLREKYAKDQDENNGKDEETTSVTDTPPLRILEIIGNDVHDTLFRYVLAHPSLIDPVETLNLVAPSPYDLDVAPQNILHQVLPQLKAMKTLVLTVGDNYSSRELLPDLVGCLPPNLDFLRFRSSVSIATADPALFDSKWVQAFADPTFLPNLKSLSFVLDLKDGEEDRKENEEYQTAAEAEAVLAQAKRACERLWRAAEGRGVVVEPWSVVQSRRKPWELPTVSESDEDSKKEFKAESRLGEGLELTGIKPVDERWEKL
ncbi:hypothetical protein BT96DRAFT_887999 [Gymnopus androsaceus JB14]|uniref:Uncharacterized protein n=1 Tax=Gymnopus androsaceus JB14 TaxID=1447944 RepID=A0A6A4H5K7_9AGAR|nr:hypothetical protein BT96DRAFT_887999 [Gymnopus androsaceus JB14]